MGLDDDLDDLINDIADTKSNKSQFGNAEASTVKFKYEIP